MTSTQDYTKDYTQDNDKLYRYLFQNRAVRGQWLRLNNTFTETLNTHHYPKPVQDLLGEMLVATSLLTATLKFEGTITVQIQGGEGALKLAVVNGNEKQQMRALARVDGEIADNTTLQQMVGEKGVLIISVMPENGERYQGVVALDKETISECLEEYFTRSEQLKTQLIIRVGEFNGEAVGAGVLLQVMPDGTGKPEDFEHLAALTSTIKNEEIFGLTAQELLFRLYHEETVEVYEPQPVSFKCGCSRERSAGALLLVSDEEITEMLAAKQGIIDMQCECCGTQYFFDEKAIQELKAVS
ncbi:Hsp33 family molecular chaperone HslO [Pasteurella atlantica]|uniref:Hsp33 family molecular chaperone HslO n=2 Tax=Pasteurellaceae TaxID=712 RepID=A0ACC6HPK4_9PAST|nr:Hsp33 family molecular chaperone HslO [Pasteurella atlantica]MDP8033250.1 Hsp33 family molecular chaperone HslO [Pasteurella atlantica]MDP8035200.1 Hsp33 family molecular chaperone HslO [Pasteurella atlantica]MDP8037150.1 Hsp33 family molecular chaperone HslO [Pasteurella atlantica]MDP8047337.1 Hsp33 family molecular chaperone HslO [Pasteurella atlantica]MDP8049439.1 Hsp33 family molecular chaperone HslO [Pasteurella atlantica]